MHSAIPATGPGGLDVKTFLHVSETLIDSFKIVHIGDVKSIDCVFGQNASTSRCFSKLIVVYIQPFSRIVAG